MRIGAAGRVANLLTVAVAGCRIENVLLPTRPPLALHREGFRMASVILFLPSLSLRPLRKPRSRDRQRKSVMRSPDQRMKKR